MKERLIKTIAFAACFFLGLAGCSKKLDTAELRANFQNLPAPQKAMIDTACDDIDKGDYKDAYMPLRKVAFGTSLDPNQVKLINNAIARVREKLPSGQ